MKPTALALALAATLCALGEESATTNTTPQQATAAADNVASPLAEALDAVAQSNAAVAQSDAVVAQSNAATPNNAATPDIAATPNNAATPDNAATARDTTDVIDLDEVDDSAEARDKAPVITATEPGDSKVTLVDIACDNATLEDVLRQFRKVTDANIISDDSTNLQRRVSVNLHHVAWLDGLQSILNSRNYRLEERGDIYFVREDKVLEPILTRSFTLNHASAKELADLFNQSYGKKDVKGTIILPIASSFDAANVVVVTATEKIIGECESIIRAVDKAVAQIYIEARFLELSSEAMHKLGIQWDSLQSWGATVKGLEGGWQYNNGRAANYGNPLTTRSISDSSNSSNGRNANTSSDGSSSATLSESTAKSHSDSKTYAGLVPSAIGQADGAGFSAADMAWRNARGFSGQLNADDFRLALSAFETMGEGKVFSNPKVIVSNGKEANVDMTTKFPNIKLTSQRNNSDYGSYLDMSAQLEQVPGAKDKGLFAGSCFFEWGITLAVRPRISPDGLISVEITPTISQLDYDSSQNGSGFYTVQSDTTVGLFPIISMKRITTDFTMKDGSTAVIGGLSRTTEDDIDTGIPYLRKIPWIGQKLFGWKSRQKVQKEIIICVTLGIANPAELPKEIGLPKNAVMAREYINGDKLEPGDRTGTAIEVLALDHRPVDKRDDKKAEDKDSKPGAVIITPVRENKAPKPPATQK